MNDYTYPKKTPSITRLLNKYFCGVLALLLLALITTIAEASMNEEGGSKKDGKSSVDPVNLSNGNLFFPRTDIHIPALGSPLELSRIFNTQVISRHADWETGLGTWVTENHELSGEGGQTWSTDQWDDVDVSIRMKTLAQDPEGRMPELEFYTGWVHFRFQDYNNHYQFLLKTNGVAELVKYAEANGVVERTFWREQTDLSPFDWNLVRIHMQGGQIQVFLNSIKVLDVTDPSPLPAGIVGFESHYAHVHWDDMAITDLHTGVLHAHDFNDEGNQEGLFGYGWSSNLEMRIEASGGGGHHHGDNPDSDPAQHAGVDLILPDGGREHFKQHNDGTFMAPLGVHKTLTQTAEAYTLRHKDGEVYTFDAMGLLSTIADRHGNRLTIQRDAQHRPLTVTDASSRAITLAYGANGKVATATDPAGNQWSYDYGTDNHLIRVTTPLGYTEHYLYDPETHNLLEYTGKTGAVYQFTYTIDDRVKTQTDPEGKVTTFDWEIPYAGQGGVGTTTVTNHHGHAWQYRFKLEDENRPEVHDQIHFITDPYGNIEGYAWDVDKNRIGKTDESGRSTYWEYDVRGNPTKIIRYVPGNPEQSSVSALKYESVFNRITELHNPDGRPVYFEYDAQGNLTRRRTPYQDGSSAEHLFTYDGRGQTLSAVDPLGHTWQFTYDAHGNLSSQQDPLGNVTDMRYNLLGQPVSITDPNGHTTQMFWDAEGRLLRLIDPIGGETSYTYDGNGNPLSVTDARGNTTHYRYDGLGNLMQTIDPLGHVTEYQWDTSDYMHLGQNYRTAVTDAQGQYTDYEYDARGRLVKETDPLGHVTEYTYDQTTHLLSAKNAENQIFHYTYDALGRLSSETDPEGNTTIYDYDKMDNLISVTDARDNTTTYQYNAYNQVRNRIYPDGSSHSLAYDKAGYLLSETTRRGDEFIYERDALGRLTKKLYPNDASIRYTYDSVGRLLSVYDLYGVNPTTYVYDALDRVLSVTNPWGQSVTYQYDSVSNRTRMTYPDGFVLNYEYDAGDRLTSIRDLAAGESYTFAYDANNQRTQLTYPNGVTSDYTYDAAQRLTGLTHTTSANQVLSRFLYTLDGLGNRTSRTTTTGTDHYLYDALNRLREITYAGSQRMVEYQFDALGNRSSVTDAEQTTTYTSNALNQYMSVNGASYAYNANGSLIQDSQRTLHYNYDNRLWYVANGNHQAYSAYDFAGRRIGHTVNGVSTNTFFDFDHAIMDTDNNGSVIRKYINGPNIDEVLAIKTQSDTFYLTRDGLNSVAEATNDQAQVVERCTYDAYGQPTLQNASGEVIPVSDIGNRFLYTGREWEPETGLYYYRARHYDPTLGRFLQPDPLGYVDGFNLYAYVGNNPINYWDPYGLFSWGNFGGAVAKGTVIGGIAGAGGGAVVGSLAGGVGAGPGALAGGVGGAVTGGIAAGLNNAWEQLFGDDSTDPSAQKNK